LVGVKVRWAYIVSISLCAGLTTMSLGAALSASGPAFTDLKFILVDISNPQNDSLQLTEYPVIGLALGALFGGLYG